MPIRRTARPKPKRRKARKTQQGHEENQHLTVRDVMDREECEVSGKRIYTEVQSVIAAWAQKKKNYPCRNCNGWHLATKKS